MNCPPSIVCLGSQCCFSGHEVLELLGTILVDLAMQLSFPTTQDEARFHLESAILFAFLNKFCIVRTWNLLGLSLLCLWFVSLLPLGNSVALCAFVSAAICLSIISLCSFSTSSRCLCSVRSDLEESFIDAYNIERIPPYLSLILYPFTMFFQHLPSIVVLDLSQQIQAMLLFFITFVLFRGYAIGILVDIVG